MRLYRLVENRRNNLTRCVIRLNIKMLFGFFILNLYPPLSPVRKGSTASVLKEFADTICSARSPSPWGEGFRVRFELIEIHPSILKKMNAFLNIKKICLFTI